jgi:hypothetical protein
LKFSYINNKNYKREVDEMKKHIIENPVSLSLGIVMHMKANRRNGMVKYQILYKDNRGREHTRWSDWMRFDGHQVGDGIPVKILTIPATFGIMSTLMEVNGQPQNYAEPHILSMALIGAGAFCLGYYINHKKSSNS